MCFRTNLLAPLLSQDQFALKRIKEEYFPFAGLFYRETLAVYNGRYEL